jgi:hypothetical protein
MTSALVLGAFLHHVIVIIFAVHVNIVEKGLALDAGH